MIFLAASAAFVGLVHSLIPGHWLPVVLMAKARRWPVRTAIAGAMTAAAGHVIISSALGAASIFIGAELFSSRETQIERYAALGLCAFGTAYALYSYFRHSRCHGHTHHGPEIRDGKRRPFLFLFSLGFSPCVAVLPVFAAASTRGSFATILSVAGFSAGVMVSLISATVLASLGLMKLDHPLLEHYGDVIAGAGIALVGAILFFIPL